MTRSEIDQKLRDLVAKELGIDEDEITADSAFVQDLGADSLDIAELAIVSEEEFDIAIDDDQIDDLKTFGALARYIEAAVTKRKPGAA